MASEEMKDASRNTIFGYVSVLVTAVVNYFLPAELQPEVRLAAVGLTLAVVMYAITWVDSYIHNNKDMKANGLLPF